VAEPTTSKAVGSIPGTARGKKKEKKKKLTKTVAPFSHYFEAGRVARTPFSE
jgi:hypothetical protein